jgi:hypothetical protein
MPVYKTEVKDIVLDLCPLFRFLGQTMLPPIDFGKTILPAPLLTVAAATRNQALAAPRTGKGMVPMRQRFDSSHTFAREADTKACRSISSLPTLAAGLYCGSTARRLSDFAARCRADSTKLGSRFQNRLSRPPSKPGNVPFFWLVTEERNHTGALNTTALDYVSSTPFHDQRSATRSPPSSCTCAYSST